RPLRPAPNSSASPAPHGACIRGEIAALLHRGVDRRNAIPCGGWVSIRVDEGPIWGGVREVLHAVVADALGELEGILLLLGGPLVSREPRWLQVLAGAAGLRERRAVRVQPRAVCYHTAGEIAARLRVRDLRAS